MEVKIKKTNKNAVIPEYSKLGDAGLDLTAVSVKYDEKLDVLEYDTGLAIEIPEGYVGLIYPRSSISKTELSLTNSVGVIDSGYRGNITFKFKIIPPYWDYSQMDDFQQRLNDGFFDMFYSAEDRDRDEDGDKLSEIKVYAVGDRIGQLIIMPYPKICFNEVDELSSTDRGEGGYGSTGN